MTDLPPTRHSTFAGAVSCGACRESCDNDFPCQCCYELKLVMLGAQPAEGVS